jgi:uncharacterized membrane protein YdjX (TVP38/TMEM64 family)
MADLLGTIAQISTIAIETFHPQQLLQNALIWVDSLGAGGGIAFIGLYVLATLLFIPGAALTLGAGVAFGWVVGSIYVLVGATLGAIAAFLTGRYLLRGWVTRRIEGNEQFQAIDAAVAREGFKIVLLTRLSPFFPFNLQNYVYGITQVSLRDYSLGSVGMIPGTVMYVYIGSLFGNLATLFSGVEGRSKTPAEFALYGLGLVATIAVTLYISKLAHTALTQKVS